MKVTIDCGSTKCDFLFSPSGKEMQCKGFNPNVSADEVLESNLVSDTELFALLKQADEIKYYGAGCGKEQNKQRVKNILTNLFPQASVHVKHDLDLSLEVLAKGEACFVNILGTGSNSLFFDGQKTHQLIPSLGYILGDEGSGAWFGRHILRDFFYNKLPQDMTEAIRTKENLSAEYAIERVYRTESPNRFLAGFSRYLSDFRGTDYVQDLLKKGFEQFIEAFIPLSTHNQYPLHFSGSIAFHFSEELKKVLTDKELFCGRIVKSPLGALI